MTGAQAAMSHAVDCEKQILALKESNRQLERELFIQTESAKLLGRVAADKDADRIFFRDKCAALTAMLTQCIGSGNLPVAIEHQARELLAK